MEYEVNKGIGQSVEIWGLRSQYIFYGAGAVLTGFLLLVILYLLGVHYILSILTGVTVGALLVWLSIFMNAQFGEYGIMKLLGRRSRPDYLK